MLHGRPPDLPNRTSSSLEQVESERGKRENDKGQKEKQKVRICYKSVYYVINVE
jgi:hypothetical protein